MTDGGTFIVYDVLDTPEGGLRLATWVLSGITGKLLVHVEQDIEMLAQTILSQIQKCSQPVQNNDDLGLAKRHPSKQQQFLMFCKRNNAGH